MKACDQLSAEFQTSLVRSVLQDHSFLKKNRQYVQHELFRSEQEREIMQHTLDFFDRYGSTPSIAILVQYMAGRGYDPDDTLDSVKPFYDVPVANVDYISEATIGFYRKNKLHNAILDSVDLVQDGKYDDVLKKIQDVVHSFQSDDRIGSMFFDSACQVLDSLDVVENVVPTGFSALDELLFGGPRRGTLNVAITPPNKGKSTVLINLGKYAALNGFRVVHYTFELSESIINRRYFMSMTKMSKMEMKTRKKTAYDKITEIAEKVTSDSLIVKEFPAYAVTPTDIRSHLRSVKNTMGFFPDLIIWDYADLMKAGQKYTERRHELASLYYDLRNMAGEFDAVGWTASQTNRQGNEEELITIQDLAECYEKAAAADIMVSVNQTLEERRSRPSTARLFLAKSRDDVSQETIEIVTDWQRSWLGNMD